MSEHDQPGSEDQDFTAAEVDLKGTTDQEDGSAPESTREQREAEINRRFFEDLKQSYEGELESVARDREMTQQALDKEKAVEEDFRSQRAIDFFEKRLGSDEEVRKVVEERLDQINTALAKLDQESSSAAA